MADVGVEQPCEVETSWPDEGLLRVRMVGEIDMFCTDDIARVASALARRPTVVQIDLGDATMVDLNGAVHIEALAAAVEQTDATLELVGASPRVLGLLKLASSPLAAAPWLPRQD